jgi:ABC-2 type transport system ATP-binding protein
MSSVEELWDNITLINRAKTILEGSVNEIRNQWAANEYDLVLSGDIRVEENGQFKILSRQFENEKTSLRLKTPGNISANDILRNVIDKGTLVSFNPALPSMNEIFIRIVESRNAETDQTSKV